MALTFDDPVLGELGYDDELEWWTGRTLLWNREVELCVWAEADIESDGSAVATMGATLQKLRDAQQTITTTTAERLTIPFARVREFNGDTTPVGHSEIAERLSIQTIELYPDGRALLYFSDGGVSGGHVILSKVAHEGQVTAVDIAG